MQENDGKYIFGVVKVGDKGQIVIPKDARTLGDQKGVALLKTEVFQGIIDRAMEGLTK